MAQQKPGLPRDEHTQLGAELAAMRDRLGRIAVQLGRAYPVAVSGQAVRAQREVDRLRSELDNIVFREYPAFSTDGNAGVYYPRGGRDAEEAR